MTSRITTPAGHSTLWTGQSTSPAGESIVRWSIPTNWIHVRHVRIRDLMLSREDNEGAMVRVVL